MWANLQFQCLLIWRTGKRDSLKVHKYLQKIYNFVLNIFHISGLKYKYQVFVIDGSWEGPTFAKHSSSSCLAGLSKPPFRFHPLKSGFASWVQAWIFCLEGQERVQPTTGLGWGVTPQLCNFWKLTKFWLFLTLGCI